MEDIRDILFKDIAEKSFRASLTSEHDGVLSGVEGAISRANELSISLRLFKKEGESIYQGETIGYILACPKKITMAEETIIGTLAKASGIATAARRAVKLSKGQCLIISGSWKKMPPETKNLVRKAVNSGGASFRICDTPMIYMDKNILRMFGSITEALKAAEAFPKHTKIIQIRGDDKSIESETEEAISNGADILMVDTGNVTDLSVCCDYIKKRNARNSVKIAFAGCVSIKDIPDLLSYNVDMLCIGKEIVDAQLLDMKLDVEKSFENIEKII